MVSRRAPLFPRSPLLTYLSFNPHVHRGGSSVVSLFFLVLVAQAASLVLSLTGSGHLVCRLSLAPPLVLPLRASSARCQDPKKNVTAWYDLFFAGGLFSPREWTEKARTSAHAQGFLPRPSPKPRPTPRKTLSWLPRALVRFFRLVAQGKKNVRPFSFLVVLWRFKSHLIKGNRSAIGEKKNLGEPLELTRIANERANARRERAPRRRIYTRCWLRSSHVTR